MNKVLRLAPGWLAWALRLLSFFWLLHAPVQVHAHQFNMGSITVVENKDKHYDVYFRYSASKATLELSSISFPSSCQSNAVVNNQIDVNRLSIRYSVRCLGNLHVELVGTESDALFYVHYEDAETGVHWTQMSRSSSLDIDHLKQAHATHNLPSDEISFFGLGVSHLLTGIDHLLVVFCYVCIVGFGRRLVGVITAFTVGHSLTLVLSVLQLIRVEAPPVEACIALSIAFLAREIFVRGQSALTFLSATFIGLIHGLGFASALGDTLARADGTTVLAEAWRDLFLFNLGIEAGQLGFIALCFVALSLFRRFTPTGLYTQPVGQWSAKNWRVVASTTVGSAAVFMLLSRVSPWITW